MKKFVVVMIVVLTAVLLPSVVSQAQQAGVPGCEDGLVVQGRCLSVDDQATLCAGTACVEFVEESIDICPGAAVNLESDPFATPLCELTEPASERDPACPEGTRGEVGDCFIYVAIGADGCPGLSALDETNNCKRPVPDAGPVYFCEDAAAQLSGRDCISMLDAIPSPCPAGTTRFGTACWRLNGLTAPESCAGHEVDGTIELASGLCQVPVPIPTGESTCTDGSEYREHPSFVLITQAGEPQGDGPVEAACVDSSTSVGISIRTCVFLDDDLDWGDVGDPGMCTRFERPATVTCPAGFTIDDAFNGLCRRLEPAVNGQCGAGGSLNGQSCVFGADFLEFDCPTGTDRDPARPICVAYRTWQGSVNCSGRAALLLPSDVFELELPFGCFPHVGPQPDQCNGEGTLENCFEVREPAPVECGTTTGCVGLSDFVAKRCRGLVVTVDMNVNGSNGLGTAGDDVILGTPGDDMIDAGDGNDTVCAGDGNDVVLAGSGDDTVLGEAGRDILRGGPGVDEVHGGDGNDRVLGGIGNDNMTGGEGDDYLGGFGGADTIDGGPGNERIFGGFGPDTIVGGPGDDVINGLIGDDTISGGPGDDTLNGDRGNDVISGDGGNDTINGGNANDILSGGAGDDSVNGGRADDQLSGGGDNDVCVGNKENVADTTDGTCELEFGIP